MIGLSERTKITVTKMESVAVEVERSISVHHPPALDERKEESGDMPVPGCFSPKVTKQE